MKEPTYDPESKMPPTSFTEPEIVKPEQLGNPDISKLKSLLEKYMDFMNTDYHSDNDYAHYISECAVEAFYGKDIWKFINSKMK